jgi:hypothetical protein
LLSLVFHHDFQHFDALRHKTLAFMARFPQDFQALVQDGGGCYRSAPDYEAFHRIATRRCADPG